MTISVPDGDPNWSYNHDRMMSVLERLNNPAKIVKYYLCGILICTRRSTSRNSSGETNSSESTYDNDMSSNPYHYMTKD
jgi:hypothetical protein